MLQKELRVLEESIKVERARQEQQRRAQEAELLTHQQLREQVLSLYSRKGAYTSSLRPQEAELLTHQQLREQVLSLYLLHWYSLYLLHVTCCTGVKAAGGRAADTPAAPRAGPLTLLA
jgi:hypothetical protein